MSTIIPVSYTHLDVYKRQVLDSISDFEALESITFMPKYQVETDSIESENTVEIKTPTEGLEYPIVGVLDTGVSKNPYCELWLLKNKFSSYPDELIDRRNGSCAVSYTHLDVYKRQVQV